MMELSLTSRYTKEEQPTRSCRLRKRRKPDLILMGTHAWRGFGRLILGSATDLVMRKAYCPVLAVCRPPRDSVAADEGALCPPLEPNSRLHGFRRKFRTGFRLCDFCDREYGAELTRMHIVEDFPDPDTTEEVIATSTEQLDKLVPAEKRQMLKIPTALPIGKPYRRIVEYVQEAQVGLVTMGVCGAGALDRAVFGSTTYRVIQLGPCPCSRGSRLSGTAGYVTT